MRVHHIVSDTDLRTGAKKVTEYLNNQGENKPVETPPYEFREWEPTIKEMKGQMEKAKQEMIKSLRVVFPAACGEFVIPAKAGIQKTRLDSVSSTE